MPRANWLRVGQVFQVTVEAHEHGQRLVLHDVLPPALPYPTDLGGQLVLELDDDRKPGMLRSVSEVVLFDAFLGVHGEERPDDCLLGFHRLFGYLIYTRPLANRWHVNSRIVTFTREQSRSLANSHVHLRIDGTSTCAVCVLLWVVVKKKKNGSSQRSRIGCYVCGAHVDQFQSCSRRFWGRLAKSQ